MQRRVAIFGATSAVAGEVARLLAAHGDRLFLIGRSEARLAALAESLGAVVVGTASADFNTPEAAAGLVRAAVEALDGLDVAFIAHGFLGDQLESERDASAAAAILNTNFISAVALLVPLANELEARRGGHLAVITSVAGDRGRPRNYTYGAAKAGLSVYLQGLRSRLWRSGVQVHTFKLGPVDTPMTATHRKHVLFAQPADVAREMVAALEGRGRERYVPGFWRPILAVVRVMPEAVFQRFGFLSGR